MLQKDCITLMKELVEQKIVAQRNFITYSTSVMTN